MAPTLLENESNSTSLVLKEVRWARQNAYRCHVCLIPEDDGTWSAIVVNLPGAASCGDSEEEALLNVREALVGLIRSYLADEEAIPWCDTTAECIPQNAKQVWIFVNA